ncbi:MAG: rhodanese-like domain-containing protein [Halofilum sp. (in: g-proteobacteria)]|nr:rhodanese-like domain-containing protein [Halofilum sp. (in: g-proteobacteria)]
MPATDEFPLLLDPAALVERLDDPTLRVIDLSPGEVFGEHHVPGAVHLPYGELVTSRPPVGGLLPDDATLLRVLRAAGIGPGVQVVAMDAEGGGAAGRLMWTLDLLGHDRTAILDGGLRAWVHEGFPLETGPGANPESGTLEAAGERTNVRGAETIMERLGDDDFICLDARSPGEYDGTTVRAARGGHIPGAAHYEWTRAMDPERNLRLRPLDDVRAELAALGVTADREVVAYCHTHHRSAFSYALLRILGFPRAAGYPGSWSDWGNRDDTPVES